MNRQFQPRNSPAFTLVEVMVVCAVIGLLAALALPSFAKARQTSRVVAFCENLRHATDAFQQYAQDYGNYPVDQNRGVVPPGMSDYLGTLNWAAPTPLGGTWDWDYQTKGVTAGISAIPDVSIAAVQSDFQQVDNRIDDGNLATGNFIANDDRYTYILEP